MFSGFFILRGRQRGHFNRFSYQFTVVLTFCCPVTIDRTITIKLRIFLGITKSSISNPDSQVSRPNPLTIAFRLSSGTTLLHDSVSPLYFNTGNGTLDLYDPDLGKRGVTLLSCPVISYISILFCDDIIFMPIILLTSNITKL